MRLPLLGSSVMLCGVSAMMAQSAAPPTSNAETLPPIFAPKPPPPKAPARQVEALPNALVKRERAISPELAAKLSDLATRAAMSTSPSAAKPGAPRDSAGSSSDAVQLAPFIVREKKESEIKEWDILTPKGKLDLAYKRHPGLRGIAIPFLSNSAVALELIKAEIEQEQKKEMTDMVRLMDKASLPKDVKRQVDEALNPMKDDPRFEKGRRFRELR
jgi:hypothetical protein